MNASPVIMGPPTPTGIQGSHRQATFVYHPVAAAFAARPIAHKCVIVPYRVLKSDYLEATTFVDGIEKSKMRAVIAPPVPPPVRA